LSTITTAQDPIQQPMSTFNSPPILPGSIASLDDLRGTDRYHVECICRAATQTVFLGGTTVLSRVLGRYKAFLDTRDRGFAAHVMLDGYWEMWLTQFIARLVEPGMHVADVGANYGYYSLLMADLVGPTGRLVAVEPNPPVVESLRRTLELNGFGGRSTVVAGAAGAGEGEGHLLVPAGEPKNASLVSRAAPSDEAALVAVPVHSLDALLGNLPRVDFLKIDAEGAEEDIVLGLGQIIARWRPRIVLEFNPARCRDAAGLLARLRGSYQVIQCLGFDAQAVPASDEDLLDPTNREDRLLYLDGEASLPARLLPAGSTHGEI